MILVISYPDEEHTLEVVKRLEQKGREVVLMDLADLPAQLGLALSWPNGDSVSLQPSYFIEGPNGKTDLGQANVGWWRRVRPFTLDHALLRPSVRAFAESETAQAVGGMLDSLPCQWVNPRGADDAAHRKPLQWTVAREVGLIVPRTLVTTQPETARQFINQVGVGKTVFKAFLATLDAWRETRLVENQDMQQLDLVRYAPVIFQEYIEGVDLRITVVGDQIFAGEIDARDTEYPVDMRMVVGHSKVQAVELPPRIQQALLKLQRRLGLCYGAIDMRRTASGDYYFLEVNPAGQWLFVEERTGLPISQAMADLLASLEVHKKAKKGKK